MTTGTPQGRSVHLGLDLGATNLKWAVIERAVIERAGTTWSRIDAGQAATRVASGPAGIVDQIAEVGQAAQARWPAIASAGIGVPGLYDPSAGTIRFLPNLAGAWAGVPMAGPVERLLGVPTALINDARAFGLAELRLGAGRGAESIVGLTLGTGVGGVVAVDGHVRLGTDGTAGEVGHQTIDPDGPLCNCGNRGCLEAYARADQIALACGQPSVESAVRAARDGDVRARSGLAEIGRYLGIGIANMITVLVPDRIVLGGGVAGAGELLLGPIRAEIARRVTTTAWQRVELVTAELGVWAGSIGAAVHGAEQAERAAIAEATAVAGG
ncbi:MAG TPA: ROK family protein [Candidatus Limnocylindrales bacterium]